MIPRRLMLLFSISLLNVFLYTVSFAQSVSFTGATNFAVAQSPRSVAAGDFNGDGRLDLGGSEWCQRQRFDSIEQR
jgi:FG-GAP-like repeat